MTYLTQGEFGAAPSKDDEDWAHSEAEAGFYLSHVHADAHIGVEDLPPLVGVVGAIGSGKSTATRTLYSALGYRRMSFGHALKESLWSAFRASGAVRGHFYGTQTQKSELIGETGRTGRELMEVLGMEFRALYPHVWVRAVEAELRDNRRYALCDVRFENEAEMIRDYGGMILRIDRPEAMLERTGRAADEEWETIHSDAYIVAREGDVLGLQTQVCQRVVNWARDNR